MTSSKDNRNVIRVKFHYRNYKPLHTIHSTLVNYPPLNVKFIIPKSKSYLSKLYPAYKKMRSMFWFKFVLNKTKKYLFSDKSNVDDYDLTHFIQFVPKEISVDKPYIVDFEHVIGLTDFVENDIYFNDHVIPFLINDQCKKIIPISEAAKKTLINKMGSRYESIQEKVKVIYPALPLNKKDKTRQFPRFRFLFVGNQVYRKGLHELLEAFSHIPKHKAELTVISDLPKKLYDKYQLDNITYLKPTFTHKEILNNYFCKSDAFVLPTHMDTFGMVILDSLSCGTPVITTNQFALPEIVENEKNGFLLNTNKEYLWHSPVVTETIQREFMKPEQDLIDQLHKKMIFCVNNPEEIRQMGTNAQNLFIGPKGKFSIERRKKLLRDVYEQAIS